MRFLLLLLFFAATALAEPKYVGVAGTSLVVRHKGNNIVCEKGTYLPGTNEVIKSFDRAKVTTNKGTKTLEQYFEGERESIRPDSEGEYNQGYDDETGGAPPPEDFEDIYSAGEEKIYKYRVGQCVMHENNESNNPKDRNMIVKITGVGNSFNRNTYCSKGWDAAAKKWKSRGGDGEDHCFGVVDSFQHESKVVECPDDDGDKAPEMIYKLQQCYRYTGPILDSKGQVKQEKTDKVLKLLRAKITTDPENYQYEFADLPKDGSDNWDHLGFKPGSENLQFLEETECP